MVGGVATNFFFGVLRASVLLALYGARRDVEGFSAQAAVAYTGVTQAVIGCLGIFGWYDVMNAIHTGEIAVDLLKPIDYFTVWAARDLGRAAANIVVRFAPIMLAYSVLFQSPLPGRAEQWLALAVVVPLAWFICFSWIFLVNLLAFWSPDAKGIGRFGFAVIWIFSGGYMPLRFFPPAFVHFCSLTPFPSMADTIVEAYLGVIHGPALLAAIGIQIVWSVILVGAIRLVLGAGFRRLAIAGG